jgi:hypothetical protein
MPIGFPAYDEDTVRFRGRTRSHLRDAAEAAFDDLKWTWRRDSKWRLVASVPMSLIMAFPLIFSWGEKVIVEVDEGELFVRSEGAFALAWLDFGKHAANIHKFLDAVEDHLGD